ncbi:replication/maintenance protein RepL [Streptomyces sp. NPDC054933]
MADHATQPEPRTPGPAAAVARRDSVAARISQSVNAMPPSQRQGVHEVRVEVRHRQPHDMYGRDGYSVTSNEFLSAVLAPAIAQHRMSPVQAAVLVYCCGKQKEGVLRTTHQKIADALTVERANVTRALAALESWNMLQRCRGKIIVNPTLVFRGNGDLQQQVLFELRAQEAESGFPRLVPPPARERMSRDEEAAG